MYIIRILLHFLNIYGHTGTKSNKKVNFKTFFFQDMNSGMQVVASYHELFNLLNEDPILILANYMQVLNFLNVSLEVRSLVLL